MESQYNLTVTEVELGAILSALSERPYKQVSMLIIKLTQQFQTQHAVIHASIESPAATVVPAPQKGKRKGG